MSAAWNFMKCGAALWIASTLWGNTLYFAAGDASPTIFATMMTVVVLTLCDATLTILKRQLDPAVGYRSMLLTFEAVCILVIIWAYAHTTVVHPIPGLLGTVYKRLMWFLVPLLGITIGECISALYSEKKEAAANKANYIAEHGNQCLVVKAMSSTQQ